MTATAIRGGVTLYSPDDGGGDGSGAVISVGLNWTTAVADPDQPFTAGSGYVGVFHNTQVFMDGDIGFDGYNLTIGNASANGIWYYAASGKIVGTPTTGVCRVVIAGLVGGATYAGELGRFIYTPAMFAAGYVGYNLFATALMQVGDNMGIYIDNQTDVTLNVEPGDPNDGTGPPTCHVLAYLLSTGFAPGS